MNDDPGLGIGNRIRDKSVFVNRRRIRQRHRRFKDIMLILRKELKDEVIARTDDLAGRTVPCAQHRNSADALQLQHVRIPSYRRRKIRQTFVARHLDGNGELRQRVDRRTIRRQSHRRRHPRIRIRKDNRPHDRFGQLRRQPVVVDA